MPFAFSLTRSQSCHKASNAPAISRTTTLISSEASSDIWHLFVSRRRKSKKNLPARKPDWLLGRRWCFSRWSLMLMSMNSSKNFYANENRDSGWEFFVVSSSLFYAVAPLLHSSRIGASIPCFLQAFNIVAYTGTSSTQCHRIIRGLMPSSPTVFEASDVSISILHEIHWRLFCL